MIFVDGAGLVVAEPVGRDDLYVCLALGDDSGLAVWVVAGSDDIVLDCQALHGSLADMTRIAQIRVHLPGQFQM